MTDQARVTRRQFVELTALGTAAAALGVASVGAAAADMPKLDPNDAQAKALQYVHQSQYPDKICVGCQLYVGAADSEWGGCPIFAGKAVAAKGWCVSWVKKAG